MKNKANPLDHYVPQAYLRQWVCSEHKTLHVFNKSTLTDFNAGTNKVCSINGGSTNIFLTNQRQIEDFLETFEDEYLNAITALCQHNYDQTHLMTICRFIAAISACSPTARRIHLPMLHESLKVSSEIIDRKGYLPKLRGEGISELLRSERAKIRVHDRFAESLIIPEVEKLAISFSNCNWELFFNRRAGENFLTSDYPIGLQIGRGYPQWNEKIVPLSPTLAVRIESTPLTQEHTAFKSYSIKAKQVTKKTACEFNRIIVRSAENFVIYNTHSPSFQDFLKRNSAYSLQQATKILELPKGKMSLNRQVLQKNFVNNSKFEPPESEQWFEFAVNSNEKSVQVN
jgi:hypothetical protein